MNGNQIVQSLGVLETERKTLDNTLQVIQQFVMPFRGEFFRPLDSEHEIDWRRREIYDDTAVNAAQTLASSMQGSLTSMATRWFRYRFRQDELNENDEAKEWLEDCENRTYNVLEDSNFDLESSEFYLDIVAFGTSIIIEELEDEQTWKGITFSVAPLAECHFQQDYKGNVCTFYRVLKWTAKQMETKWGKDALPQYIKDELDNPTAKTTRHEIVFCIYYDISNVNADISKVLSPQARPYQYKYICRKDGSQLGETGGYYEMPAFVGRWRRVSGSKYGYSPSHVVLSTILMLNELQEATIEALGKVVDPATLVTERGLLSDLDLERGGLTVVRSMDDIKVYESKARFDVGNLSAEDMRRMINQAFHVDQLQLKDSPAMTATESSIRYELMQRLLGPTTGRMKNDFLDKLVNNTFNMMFREKQFLPMPQIVKDMKGELEIEYVGPMPRAQKMNDVTAVQRWVHEDILPLAESFPDIADLPDLDAIARFGAEARGVPAKLVNDKDKVKEKRDSRQEQLATQTALVNAEQGGKAMEAIGKGKEAISGV